MWVREGHDAPVQAPARPARLLLKKTNVSLKHISTYFYRPLRFYAQAQCLRAGAVSSNFLLSTGVWVREGHDAPVQAPARPARLLLKKQMVL